jgi:uncharacterized phosphosugar-binding protein
MAERSLEYSLSSCAAGAAAHALLLLGDIAINNWCIGGDIVLEQLLPALSERYHQARRGRIHQ